MKLCKDCAYFLESTKECGASPEVRPGKVDLVTGEVLAPVLWLCKTERGPFGDCGEEGKLFRISERIK